MIGPECPGEGYYMKIFYGEEEERDIAFWEDSVVPIQQSLKNLGATGRRVSIYRYKYPNDKE